MERQPIIVSFLLALALCACMAGDETNRRNGLIPRLTCPENEPTGKANGRLLRLGPQIQNWSVLISLSAIVEV